MPQKFACKNYGFTWKLWLNDPAIDAVKFVLTNLESHLEYTQLALKAGEARALVEKPVGVSIAEIQQMKETADAKGLIRMPGHNYVYESGMTAAPVNSSITATLARWSRRTSCTTFTTPRRWRNATPASSGKFSRTIPISCFISSAHRSNSAP